MLTVCCARTEAVAPNTEWCCRPEVTDKAHNELLVMASKNAAEFAQTKTVDVELDNNFCIETAAVAGEHTPQD